MYHRMNGYGWGWGLILGVIILMSIIWFIVRTTNQNNISQGSNKTPMEILKERYAKGEIDKEEYEEYKKNLM